MATGKIENLTGEISYSREHELTAYDDILTISSATLSLLKPAGDLMLMQGNDTVTITNSTIIGDTGVGLLLGSGDDTLTIQNSEIKSRISLASGNDHVVISGSAQSVVTLTALDPDQTSIDTDEDLTTLSLGADNDVLELCSILQGTGVINFGSGSDTLVFNAGTLNNTGGIANLNNLTVTNLGGTTYRDLELVDAGNRIEWNGNLRGNDNAKWIVLDAVSGTALAEAAFITDNNVVSNIGFKITNRTFVQTDGGTWEISGRSGNTAFMADDSKVTLYHMVLTENKTGFSGNNTDWNLNKSNISNHSERGAVITGGSLTFNDLSFTGNAMTYSKLSGQDSFAQGGGLHITGATVSGQRGYIYRNSANISGFASTSAKSSAYISIDSDYYYSSTEKIVSSNDSLKTYAKGGGVYAENAKLFAENMDFASNCASAFVTGYTFAGATAYARNVLGNKYSYNATAYASADASIGIHAYGGAIFIDSSNLTLEKSNFSNNFVCAYSSNTGGVWAHATSWGGKEMASAFAFADGSINKFAQGGGIYSENSDLLLTDVKFLGNYASAARTGEYSDYSYGAYATASASNSSYKSHEIYPIASVSAGKSTAYAENKVDVTYARGGALFASTGKAELISAVFSGNRAEADGGESQGGAIYADNAVINLTDSTFTGNKARKGGALYGANNSKFTYALSNNSMNFLKKITISGNKADEGGFLYLENSTADFIIGSNIKLLLADSIAGNGGIITKSGADMEISAAVSDDSIRWNIASGLLELSSISRTINLNNWTIGANAVLRLSALDDTVNMSTDKKIGTLDLGGGSDVINTGGYSLSEGKLLVSKLIFTGGGRVSSTISTRTADASFDITLKDVILDSTIIGGNGNDIIKIIENSTVGGFINLGNGTNTIYATASTAFKSNLIVGNGNDILTFTDVSFSNGLTLGDGNNHFTATGDASFADISAGSGDDVFSFSYAQVSGILNLGGGDNSVTASSLICLNDVTAGDGNDTISLTGSNNASTFSGMVDLGLGDNKLYIEGNVTGNIDFMLHKGGTTTAVVYRGASITGKTVSVYFRPNAELKALTLDWSDFSGDEALDKVRILISSDASFSSYEYSIELYNRVTDFTINLEEGYFYQFQANDEDGWAQRYLPDIIAPDQVTGLVWENCIGSWDIAHDNWGGNGVKQYHVEVSADAGFGSILYSETVTATEYAFAELCNGKYYWRVRAEDYTGNMSEWSDVQSFQIGSSTPGSVPTKSDFDGNGVSDILFQNLVDSANPLGAWMNADKWQWNGALGAAPKSDWTVYGAYDFTGDGVCDIMFRSKLASTEYAVGYYDMGDNATFKTMGWGVTAEWELADVGDFNGSGRADILWKNSTNGYLGLWMDGTDQWVALPASNLGEGQSIIGMGDVNGDGCDDILINSNGVLGAWDISGVINGTEATPVWSSFGINIGSEWDAFGCADFDGNGKADIVLWRDDDGYVGTYMNCNVNDFRGIYPGASKDEWGLPGFGDYNGDGCDDVLVRNLASGALGYWDGADDFKWNEIGSGVDSTWAVIA